MNRCEYNYEANSILITNFTVGIVEGSILVKNDTTFIIVDNSKIKANKHKILGYRYTIEGIKEFFQSYFAEKRFTKYIILQVANNRFIKPL